MPDTVSGNNHYPSASARPQNIPTLRKEIRFLEHCPGTFPVIGNGCQNTQDIYLLTNLYSLMNRYWKIFDEFRLIRV